MEYLAIVVIVFTFFQLVVSLVNLLFGQKRQYTTDRNCLVSVLIPARNEENNITNILTDLLEQDYFNIEIIVFDDQSSDKTPEKVMLFAEKNSGIQLIRSEGLPEGWLGKNYACHSLARKAGGEYLLFLDADVRVKDGLISGAVARADHLNTGLISVFPKQEMVSTGESLTVPLMKYILLTLLPLILVRKSHFSTLSAANGQFMFFNAQTYKKLLPHLKMKDRKVEDIEIARYLKKSGVRIACLASDKNISCRMYHSFSEAVDGFAKNVNMFFGNSYFLSLMFWLITTLGFVPVLISYGITGLVFYLAAVICIRTAVSIAGNEPVIRNILLAVFQQFVLLIIIARSIRLKLKKQYIWKGRKLA
jgi:glycosyltransferase involved in cell wall biosynthesis